MPGRLFECCYGVRHSRPYPRFPRGGRSGRFLQFFLHMLRENFMSNFQQPELVYMTQEEEDFARNFARFINEGNILQLYELANRAIRDIGQNANAKIVFFDFALQMIVLLIQK